MRNPSSNPASRLFNVLPQRGSVPAGFSLLVLWTVGPPGDAWASWSEVRVVQGGSLWLEALLWALLLNSCVAWDQ